MGKISTPLDDMDSIIEGKLKNKTMKISIAEGSFGVFSSVLADNYIVPFSLSLHSSLFQVGLISSLGNIVSPIGQMIGSHQIENKSRKYIILSGILGQASVWPLFIIIALLFQFNAFQFYLPWILIIIFLIYMLFAGIMTPPWFSLMGDIVPENNRGRYFAKRNLITQSIGIIGIILLSFLLDWFKFQDLVYYGFILIFVFGFITRLVSAFLYTKHYYPPFFFETIDHVKTSQFIKEIPKSNFGRFTLFVSLLTFGQWIAKPFFSVYMLTYLNFEYSLFMTINLSSTLIGLIFFPLLGRFSDRFGNVKLLRIGAIIIPILPFFWIIYVNPLQILLGIQILSGIAWTAFNLAASNFIYDNIQSKSRGKYIAIYNTLIGLAVIGGGLLGSTLISFIEINLMNSYHFIFLLSGIIRIIVVLGLLRKIKEVRVSTKPIINIKDLSIYKWLYDITVRTKISKKKKKSNMKV
ncbi:MAG: MFS transporter [Candidatus Odinarchaeota archaeon]